jgi:hypothetical protein
MPFREAAHAEPECAHLAQQPTRVRDRPLDQGPLLLPKPFLIMDFRSKEFFLDGDRDGCVDATGTLALPEIDPADFLPAVDGAEELCNEDLLSQRQLNDLAAAP